MRRILLVLTGFMLIILVGCDNKIEKQGIDSKAKVEEIVDKIEDESDETIFDKIKSDLLLIPKEYTLDTAISDGLFVVVHENIKSSRTIMENFILDSLNGKPTSITIFEYTIEGDPIITKIIYDGNKYYGVYDNTRDKFRGADYYEFQFKYLKEFEEDGNKIYYLLNDNKITYKDITNSYLSSDSNDDIDHKYLYGLEKSINDAFNNISKVKIQSNRQVFNSYEKVIFSPVLEGNIDKDIQYRWIIENESIKNNIYIEALVTENGPSKEIINYGEAVELGIYAEVSYIDGARVSTNLKLQLEEVGTNKVLGSDEIVIEYFEGMYRIIEK